MICLNLSLQTSVTQPSLLLLLHPRLKILFRKRSTEPNVLLHISGTINVIYFKHVAVQFHSASGSRTHQLGTPHSLSKVLYIIHYLPLVKSSLLSSPLNLNQKHIKNLSNITVGSMLQKLKLGLCKIITHGS